MAPGGAQAPIVGLHATSTTPRRKWAGGRMPPRPQRWSRGEADSPHHAKANADACIHADFSTIQPACSQPPVTCGTPSPVPQKRTGRQGAGSAAMLAATSNEGATWATLRNLRTTYFAAAASSVVSSIFALSTMRPTSHRSVLFCVRSRTWEGSTRASHRRRVSEGGASVRLVAGSPAVSATVSAPLDMRLIAGGHSTKHCVHARRTHKRNTPPPKHSAPCWRTIRLDSTRIDATRLDSMRL